MHSPNLPNRCYAFYTDRWWQKIKTKMNENIKELVSQDLIRAFEQIKLIVKNNRNKSNTLRLIEADYYQLKSQELQNVISFENANLKISQIRKRTLDLIDSIDNSNSKHQLFDFTDTMEYPEIFIRGFQDYAENFGKALDKLEFLKKMISFLPFFASESKKYDMDRKTEMFISTVESSNINLKSIFIEAKKNCEIVLSQIKSVKKVSDKQVLVADKEMNFDLIIEKLKFSYNELYSFADTGIEMIDIEKRNISNRINSVTKSNVNRISNCLNNMKELFQEIITFLKEFIRKMNSATNNG